MHQGLAPARVAPWRPRAPKGDALEFRTMTAVEGVQPMRDPRTGRTKLVPYRHDFEDGAGPTMLAVGRGRNNLVLDGGSYTVNAEGMIEDMSRKRYRFKMNPGGMGTEATLGTFVKFGLAFFSVTFIVDLLTGASAADNGFLPASVSNRMKVIGRDLLLLLGGVMVWRKSKVWGLAMGGFAVGDATALLVTGLNLDTKIRNLFHRAPAAGRTVARVDPIAAGGFTVTYSDGSVATLPAGSTAPALGSSGTLYLPAGSMQANPSTMRQPGMVRR